MRVKLTWFVRATRTSWSCMRSALVADGAVIVLVLLCIVESTPCPRPQ